MILGRCLFLKLPLNHKRTTSSFAPPIFYVAKSFVIKIWRMGKNLVLKKDDSSKKKFIVVSQQVMKSDPAVDGCPVGGKKRENKFTIVNSGCTFIYTFILRLKNFYVPIVENPELSCIDYLKYFYNSGIL